MKKLVSLLLTVCLLLTVAPVAYADGNADPIYVVRTYEDLLSWKNGELPSVFCISPAADFGWPEEEVVLDFAGLASLSMYGGSWTIPANVTIRHMSIGVMESNGEAASLTINGKWENEMYTNNITAAGSTITLGEGAKVTGLICINDGSTLMANNASVQNISASHNSGDPDKTFAKVSGTLTAEEININIGMTMQMQAGSLTVGRIQGTAQTLFEIGDGAEVVVTRSPITSNISVLSGGKLCLLYSSHLDNTLHIEKDGQVNTYGGISLYGGEVNRITGEGTINLYGWVHFRYTKAGEDRDTDYTKNPGNLPELESTVVLRAVDECDHAGGKAYQYRPVYKEVNGQDVTTTHMLQCVGCYQNKEDSEAPHSYVATEYHDGISYQCVCEERYFVQRLSGSCGEAIDFTLTEGTLALDGSGATSDFTAANVPWAQKAAEIKSVEMGTAITGIGTGTFSGCTALQKVEYDGSYEDWKALDIAEGNEPLQYAQIAFADGSSLLAPVSEYRGQAEFYLQPAEEAFNLRITGDSGSAATVFIAVFGDDGKLERLEAATKTEADGYADYTGTMPSDKTFKLMVWEQTCMPMTCNFGE